jgi:hypothetical protein
MSTDWLPSRDTLLQTFAVNFSAKITTNFASYGLVTGDATALATLVTSFNSALAAATNPPTRTKTTVAAKNVAKAQLVADIRILAKRIQANPAVTIPQKTDLGLPIKSAPTPIPVPAVKPDVTLTNIDIRTHTVRVTDLTTPSKRGKPDGVQGAEVYVFVAAAGTTPPADLSQWRFEGLTTDPDFSISYADADAGKTASIVARWYNPRGEAGPNSTPVVVPIAA